MIWRLIHRCPRRGTKRWPALGVLVLTWVGCNPPADSPRPEVPPAADGSKPGVEGASKTSDISSDKDQKPATGPASKPKLVGDREEGAGPRSKPRAMAPQPPSPFRFAEVARESGIDFVHFSGMTEAKHFPTANGSGVAFFDYDLDGKLDVYFANATLLPLGTANKGPNRLYRNLGDGKFADATAASGLGFEGFCHGIIAGDVDNDGDPDVFLCNYGSNRLYLNDGKGVFKDVSAEARVDRPGWSSGGAMLDFDDDGDLDIYVANYGIWNYPQDDLFCGDTVSKVRFYCSPRSITTTKHYLLRNNGDGTFTDVYDEVFVDAAGKPIPGRSDGHGFAAVAADLDNDGKVDLYVTNDMNPNFLFINRGGGKMYDATEASGAAYDDRGQAQSGMGVDAADIDGDGDLDVIASNFDHEYNTLHLNLGQASFVDVTPMLGLAADTTPYVGWGLGLVDFDSDGWPDCFVANGHVDNNRDQVGQDSDYAEPALLHRNVPIRSGQGRRFQISTRDVGPYFDAKHVSRGAAFGDFDDDGDVDIAVSQKDGPASLLRNDTPIGRNRWIRLTLQGTKSNRDAIGARVEVEVVDPASPDKPGDKPAPRTIYLQRKGGCSLFATNDPRLTIGLGDVPEVLKITVRWPSGAVSTREHVATNQAIRIVEGEAQAP